jgi:hypothetical protein
MIMHAATGFPIAWPPFNKATAMMEGLRPPSELSASRYSKLILMIVMRSGFQYPGDL